MVKAWKLSLHTLIPRRNPLPIAILHLRAGVTTSRFSRSLGIHGVFKGKSSRFMAELFRLVNYDDLPRGLDGHN